MRSSTVERRLPIGAEAAPGGVHFRVWAPKRRRVAVALEGGGEHELRREPGGYWAGLVSAARVGSLYRYRLDDDERIYPDPVSRCQPAGPHEPSEVVDPCGYRWRDDGWRGIELPGQVIYELHVGAFTREGTGAAAAGQIEELARLGVTVLELMPVAEFPGSFGWGYDGVHPFAPTRLYGRPDDFRAFVDRAHGLGLAVILDVVYNHLGPSGNYFRAFADDYFTERYTTEWGEAMNFDGPNAGPVRELFTCNAAYWVDEYHLDGLRLDATQCMYDASPTHVVAEVTAAARRAARGRGTIVVAENEPQDTRLVREMGVDALWNNDLHHSAIVALTGRNEAYYSDYMGTAQELVSAARHGFLYQGQRYLWQRRRRGTSTRGLPLAAFVTFIQNHDQIANSAKGERVHRQSSPARYRAMTAFMLLIPGTPMLFMGQEFAASAPFLYFADHAGEEGLNELVRRGRRAFLEQFASVAHPETGRRLADPADPATFERCKLDHGERERHGWAYALHRDLLRLRREDPTLRAQRPVDGAVLGPEAFVLRFAGEEEDDRLLLVNLGRDMRLVPAPEPLLAPPAGTRWAVRWSSEDPAYGGYGTPPPETDEGWWLRGEAATFMVPMADS